MQQRSLGSSSLQVPALSLGAMTFGYGEGDFGSIGAVHGEAAHRLVSLALDAGVTMFDTSDNYSGGQSEVILGEALGARRKEALIASKVFGRTGPGEFDVGLSRKHIVEACEASLKRLGTDWIDLYQVHNFDGLVPLEETLRALNELVHSGKVRHIGCSNYFGWQLAKACGLADKEGHQRFVSQQIQYSLMVRDAEVELLPAGIDLGLSALIFSPLAQGYLTGKFSGEAQKGARLVNRKHLWLFDTARGKSIVGALQSVAQAHGAAPGQIALAWLLQRPGIASVIVGARTEAQLMENRAAADIRLSDAEMQKLDVVSALPPSYPRSAQRIFHPERNPMVFSGQSGNNRAASIPPTTDPRNAT